MYNTSLAAVSDGESDVLFADMSAQCDVSGMTTASMLSDVLVRTLKTCHGSISPGTVKIGDVTAELLPRNDNVTVVQYCCFQSAIAIE